MVLKVADYEVLMQNALKNFISGSEALGEPLTSLSAKVKQVFIKQFDLIEYGISNSEPTNDQPIKSAFLAAISDVMNFPDHHNSPLSNHVATVREGIAALGWIFVPKTPSPYIRDFRDASMYYSNRVLQNFKGNDLHIYYVQKWGELLQELQEYVRKHHQTGFVWGIGAGAHIPPPPPPPAPMLLTGTVENLAQDLGRQALLADLNQGANIARNLRHVDRKAERAEIKPRGAPTGQKGLPTAQMQKNLPLPPPKFALEGRKWIVEYYKDATQPITIESDDMAQSVSVFKCDSSGVDVKNKVNSVTIDQCKKTYIALKDVISSVEIIRCERIKIQCSGNVPLINLDNCDSCEIYLTKEARGVEVISSKCNSSNICLLEKDGNYKEISIPEQIKTVVIGEKLQSSVVEKI